MEIIKNNGIKSIKFKDLADGDVFSRTDSNLLYMKIMEIQFYDINAIEDNDKEDAKDAVNAVSLTHNHTSWFDDDDIVYKVNAHIVID